MEKFNVFKDLVVVEVFSNVFNGLVVVVDSLVVVESAQGLALTERP